jgi:hypothetical protein
MRPLCLEKKIRLIYIVDRQFQVLAFGWFNISFVLNHRSSFFGKKNVNFFIWAIKSKFRIWFVFKAMHNDDTWILFIQYHKKKLHLFKKNFNHE